MNVAEVVDLALAAIDSERVDVELLEPADIATEAVSALSQVVAELVENATAFSGPDQRVRVNGLFETDGYLITISDDGVGISETMLAALNRVLERPTPPTSDDEVTLGVTMVARLAARHGIAVRLVPGVPGTTARIMVPSRLASPGGAPRPRPTAERVSTPIDEVFAETVEETIDMSRYERPTRTGTQHVVSMTVEAKEEAEAFLDSVFAPLRARASTGRDRPTPRRDGYDAGVTRDEVGPGPEREPRARLATLRVRVPGQSFSPEEDEKSVTSSEAAIDIRSALNRYERGRRDARRSDASG